MSDDHAREKLASDMVRDMLELLNEQILEAQKQGIRDLALAELNLNVAARFFGSAVASAAHHTGNTVEIVLGRTWPGVKWYADDWADLIKQHCFEPGDALAVGDDAPPPSVKN